MTPSSYERLSHAKWAGQYPVVFSPQGRQHALYGKRRRVRGPGLRAGAGQRGRTSVAGPMGQAHGPRRSRMPPQYAVAEVMGSRKGQHAIAVARQCGGRQSNWNGERVWARGYAGSTVGFEAEQRRASIKPQAQLDAQGSAEPGEFSQRDRGPWQPSGLLTTVKPPALRGRYDSRLAHVRALPASSRRGGRLVRSRCTPRATMIPYSLKRLRP